jgi:hypothetical protein
VVLAAYITANRQQASGLLKESGPGDKCQRAQKNDACDEQQRLEKGTGQPGAFFD